MTNREMIAQSIARKNTYLCLGLDPDPGKLPPGFTSTPSDIVRLCSEIIANTAQHVAAIKVNTAFFERMGSEGWRAMEKVRGLIPSDVVAIADAKRGDIGNTSKAYSDSILGVLDFDCVTVSPYMGRDSIEPFLESPEKGVFLLVLTSNPGSNDFQRLRVDGQPLYMAVARSARAWTDRQNLGFVVGATHPGELATLRAEFPEIPFLVPGVGTQGGDPASVVAANNGGVMLVNASRAIVSASVGEDYLDAAQKAALNLSTSLAVRNAHNK